MARAFAIIGMLLVHVGPTGRYGFQAQLYAFPHGRSSILFMVLAGLGVTMLLASNRKSLSLGRQKMAWNALFLLLAGLSLQVFWGGRWVILQHFTPLFLAAIGLAMLSNRGLLAVAVVSAALGPLIFLAGQIYWPEWFNQAAVSWNSGLPAILHGMLLTGPYPVITYLAPFVFGMWLGRLDLRSRETRANLVFRGGAAALVAGMLSFSLQSWVILPTAVAGWDWLVIIKPHNQMPLWLIGGIGSAACVLGLSLYVADVMGRWAWPLVAFGQLALTIYVAHVLLLILWRPVFTSDQYREAILIVLVIVAVASGFAMLWRRWFSRGPLELVMNMPWYALEQMQRRKEAGYGKQNTPA